MSPGNYVNLQLFVGDKEKPTRKVILISTQIRNNVRTCCDINCPTFLITILRYIVCKRKWCSSYRIGNCIIYNKKLSDMFYCQLWSICNSQLTYIEPRWSSNWPFLQIVIADTQVIIKRWHGVRVVIDSRRQKYCVVINTHEVRWPLYKSPLFISKFWQTGFSVTLLSTFFCNPLCKFFRKTSFWSKYWFCI